MQQLTCVGPRELEWREVAEPRLTADGDALIRPLAVARCEIDPLLIAGGPIREAPFALGHECVAEIVELADDVRGLEVGQLVVPSFQISCGDCVPCGRGHSGNCAAYPVLSDYGMQPLSGVEYGGMLSDLAHVPHAESMLQAVPAGFDPVTLASVSDNVLDGYRGVARHLKSMPGADVLVVCHGTPSIALYGVQAALALGAGSVRFTSDSPEALRLAADLGATVLETDFGKRVGRYPIVMDCGMRAEGLHFSLGSTEPEGICQSVSFFPGAMTPVPMGKLYTLGIQFFVGRAHAASLLPEVMPLIESGKLDPAKVTTRVVDWKDAPEAYLEDTIKLVVSRAD